jgi:ATP-binding cassette, subfamily B, bacterial CvaB/MchF/RaxB
MSLRRRPPMTPMILQSVNAECGLACVAMVAAAYGRREDLVAMERRSGAGVRGVSLSTLRRIAADAGLRSRVVELSAATLHRLKLPAIAHWDGRHYVVIAKVAGGRVTINDPADGRRTLTLEEIAQRLSGVAVELTPAPEFRQGDFRLRGAFRRMLAPALPTGRQWGRLLLLLTATQGAAVLVPLSFQIGIDKLIPMGDGALVIQVYAAFSCLVVLDALLKGARDRFAALVGNALRLSLSTALLSRCLSLPLSFFEGRAAGDVASKYESLSDIQRVLVEESPKVLIDLSLALTTGALLLLWQPALAAVSFGAAALYGLFIAARAQAGAEAADHAFLARCAERAHVLESIQIVRTIKSFSLLTSRMAAWRRVVDGSIAAETSLSLHRRRFMIVREAVSNMEVLASGAVICLLLLQSQITLGGVVAMLVYKRFFIGSVFGVIDFMPRISLIRRNADRLTDILVAQPESDTRPDPASPHPCPGSPARLTVRGLAFTYAGAERPAFADLCFEAAPGQMVALAGPSGCGKTTAIKVMLGLLPVQQGQVLHEGRSIASDLDAWRGRVSAVFQDDVLVSGSIAMNIALGEVVDDPTAVEQAARLACIHEDISELPLGYHTLVGDGALPLSRGQIQRILIARALHRRPSVLFLDEGTANLDVATEARVLTNLRATSRLIVHAAHRPTVLNRCDQVIHLEAPETTGIPSLSTTTHEHV